MVGVCIWASVLADRATLPSPINPSASASSMELIVGPGCPSIQGFCKGLKQVLGNLKTNIEKRKQGKYNTYSTHTHLSYQNADDNPTFCQPTSLFLGRPLFKTCREPAAWRSLGLLTRSLPWPFICPFPCALHFWGSLPLHSLPFPWSHFPCHWSELTLGKGPLPHFPQLQSR